MSGKTDLGKIENGHSLVTSSKKLLAKSIEAARYFIPYILKKRTWNAWNLFTARKGHIVAEGFMIKLSPRFGRGDIRQRDD